MHEKLKLSLPMSNGGTQNITVPDDLQLSIPTLNKDLGEHPGWYAHYGLIAAHAAAIRDTVSQALKDTMAAVEIDIRAEIEKKPEVKKPTEDKIRAQVQLHPEVIGARSRLLVAERQAVEAAVIKEAYYHRKDVMIALAANYRAELHQPNSK